MDAVETGGDRLARFASTLFEEDIPTEAVIVEDRLTVEEIVKPEEDLISLDLPTSEDCEPQADEDATAYAIRQARVWGGPEFAEPTTGDVCDGLRLRATAIERWSVALGDWLKGTQLFKHLLELFDAAERSFEGPLTWTKLVERLAAKDFSFITVPNLEDRKRIITAFFALVAHAKEIRSKGAFPLVPTQVQLWVRELARIGRVVEEQPIFGWLDEPSPEQTLLPAFQCNECGASGWIGLQNRQSDAAVNARGVQGFKLTNDISAIYRGWFGRNGSHDQRIVLRDFQEINYSAKMII